MIIYVNKEDMRSYALTKDVAWETIEVEVDDDFIGGGKYYDLESKTWIDDAIEPPTQQEIEAQKEAENIAFINYEEKRTEDAIVKLKRVVDRGIATEEELQRFDALEIYSIQLMRVPNKDGYPLNPIFPECPEFFK